MLRFTGTSAIAGTLAILLLAIGLYGASVVRRGFSTRTQPSQLEKAIAVSARSLAVPARARELRNPVPASPQVIAEAKAHWADHCAQCHANNGSGAAELGRNLYPRSPDMRLPATQNLTDGQLYSTINNGIRLSGMPAFGKSGEEDLASWKLVDFIRYLPRMSEGEADQMEKMNPKTPAELKEEQQEDQFLNGPSQPQKNARGREP